jgi:Xaa-Pro dipeptidase
MPVGVDIIEPPMLFELEKAGLKIADGQQTMLEAREIKSIDEIALLNRAAAMVDGAYHLGARGAQARRARERHRRHGQRVPLPPRLRRRGGDQRHLGERCNPHPHNFTDRMLRPGDQAFFDILQSFMGYRTCYYRTFNVGRATPVQHDAYKKAREWLDKAIALIKPGRVHRQGVQRVAEGRGVRLPRRDSAFGLQFGHGIGCAIHERPIISRVVSLDHPPRSRRAWCSRSETYCPAKDGYLGRAHRGGGGGHDKGCRVITLFPAESCRSRTGIDGRRRLFRLAAMRLRENVEIAGLSLKWQRE